MVFLNNVISDNYIRVHIVAKISVANFSSLTDTEYSRINVKSL